MTFCLGKRRTFHVGSQAPHRLAMSSNDEPRRRIEGEPKRFASLASKQAFLALMSSADEQCEQLDPSDEKREQQDGAPAPSPPSDNPVCWLCLADGPDESGKPLRRDCSCRGSSGFAHFDCIVNYVKQKADPGGVGNHWKNCHCCRQNYRGELAFDVAAECVARAEEVHSDDKGKLAKALHVKLEVMVMQRKYAEASQVADRMISIVGEARGGIFPAPLPRPVLAIEACAYNALALATIENAKPTPSRSVVLAAKTCLEKSRDIYRDLGIQHEVETVVSNIVYLDVQFGGDTSPERFEDLVKAKTKIHEQKVSTYGGASAEAMRSGIPLSFYLRRTNRKIEAERFLIGLVTACKRVHGPHHILTKDVEEALHFTKARYVEVCDSSGGSLGLFQALRYNESEGREKCVVRGPISEPRSVDSESTISVPVDRVSHSTACKCGVGLGNPVVCRGLKHEAHLNGKIGDVKSYDELSGCFYVQFEDSAIGLRLVKKEACESYSTCLLRQASLSH
ncbi:hypothetical protein ACHAXT_005846 [Thalassiosira profunda]